MGLALPYFRIYRPHVDSCNDYKGYIGDSRYSSDRNQLWRSYKILEKDLKRLLEYVEPSDENLVTFSHRIYELLLRASTEFETNCKQILKANGYTKSGYFNIIDYKKLDIGMKLSEYKVVVPFWNPSSKVLKPFEDWNSTDVLNWYQSYNISKHNRSSEFKEANLENVVKAVAAVFIILFAQFGVLANTNNVMHMDHGSNHIGFMDDTMFEIIVPSSWDDADKYDFDWEQIKGNTNPFSRYQF